ncbi:MAG: hypothetical protein JWR53_1439 [Glaciihabitans sp.]|nr:hypothetical protein [Glaciihabitans sp.]
MNLRRALVAPAVALLLVASLAACSAAPASPSGAPSAPSAPSTPPPVLALAGTTWSGTDSLGDDTTFMFHPTGSIGVAFGSNRYDDPLDTWTLNGTALAIDVYIDKTRGIAHYTATVAAGASALALSAAYQGSGTTFTLNLARK